MDESNKLLVDILATIVLPKLKGLSDRNAKKMVQSSQKSLTDIAKKYHKLMAEQAKDVAKQKAKSSKLARKAATKEAKKNQKFVNKASKQSKISLLIEGVKPIVASKAIVPSVPKAKTSMKTIARPSAVKK